MTTPVLTMALVGTAAGVLLGRATGRYLESLLFGIEVADVMAFVLPGFSLGVAAVLASVRRAVWVVRTDPAQTLRAE